MKEAINQALELAAENADFPICRSDYGCLWGYDSRSVNTQAILNTIDQIE